MDETDKTLRKCFEEVTTQNVRAAVAHSNDTRTLVRNLDEKVIRLENIIHTQKATIDQFRIQLAYLQTKVFRGGT